MSFFSSFFMQNSSSSSGSSQHLNADSYYGHEDVAKMCARFVSHTFNCPEMLPPTTSMSTTVASPAIPPTLAHFVAYALHRTRLHQSVTFTALGLLCRLKTRFPAARGSSGHRLFLSAFMIASKVVCDDTYSNKSWAVVGQGMFALREINQMEREMCAYLEWHLNIPEQDLSTFEREVRKVYSHPPPYSSGTAVTLGSSTLQSVSGTSGTATIVAEPKESSSGRGDLVVNVNTNAQLPTPTELGPAAMPFSSSSKPVLPQINTSFASSSHRSSHPAPPLPKQHGMITPPASPPPHSASSQSTTGATIGFDMPASSSPITDSPSPSSTEDSLPTPPNAQQAYAHAHPQLVKSASMPSAHSVPSVGVALARHGHGSGIYSSTTAHGSSSGSNDVDEVMDDEKKGVAYYAAYSHTPAVSGGPHMAAKNQMQQQAQSKAPQRTQSLPNASTSTSTNPASATTTTQQPKQPQRGTGRTFTIPCTW